MAVETDQSGPLVKRRSSRLGVLLALFVVLAGRVPPPDAGAAQGAEELPLPPRQPPSGPGGAAGRFEEVVVTRSGSAPLGFWLFEPAGPVDQNRGDADNPLPLVLFLHGFTAVDPERYRLWIDHIVRRGAVVVYPDYQRATPLGDDWSTFLPNTIGAVRSALASLRSSGGGNVDLTRLAVVGHSLGGVLAIGYAAVASAARVPPADVVMAVEPGGCGGCPPLSEGQGAPLPDLARVPATTKLLVLVGDADNVVGDGAAKRIWAGTTSVPAADRDYVTVVSDHHGSPPLRADHLFPQTKGRGSTTDALDWFGAWKLLDLLIDCAYDGLDCDDALGGSIRQRTMGTWSDGTPVAELRVSDGPAASNR